MWLRSVEMLLIIGCVAVSHICAAPITFIYEFDASGTLGNTPFESRVTFSASADTDNIEVRGSVFALKSESTISIDGLGTFDLISETSSFLNTEPAVVGLEEFIGGRNIVIGPWTTDLGSWQMSSSFGPLVGEVNVITRPVRTTAGALRFANSLTTGTFAAVVIPEPSTFCSSLSAVAVVLPVFLRWQVFR